MALYSQCHARWMSEFFNLMSVGRKDKEKTKKILAYTCDAKAIISPKVFCEIRNAQNLFRVGLSSGARWGSSWRSAHFLVGCGRDAHLSIPHFIRLRRLAFAIITAPTHLDICLLRKFPVATDREADGITAVGVSLFTSDSYDNSVGLSVSVLSVTPWYTDHRPGEIETSRL